MDRFDCALRSPDCGTGRAVARVIGFALGLASLASVGCGARHAGSYRLVDVAGGPMLVPPGITSLHGNAKTFPVHPSTRNPDCTSHVDGIKVASRRNTVTVSIRQKTLGVGPPGWLSRWVDNLSDSGCLPVDERARFVRAVLEAFPLRARDTYRIAFGQPSASDAIDLYPGQRLKVVGPVLRDDAEGPDVTVESTVSDGAGGLGLQLRASSNLVGYEESWYLITVAGNGDLRLKRDHTTLYCDGEAVLLERPAATAISFIPEGRFIRMAYLTRVAETTDHDVLFVSGSTREELETRSAAISQDPRQCLDESSNEWCRTASSKLAINLYVTVALNSAEEAVAPGLSIGRFLGRGVGRGTSAVPAGLEVYRPHGTRLARVEFDPSSGAILSLPLLGGERIILPERHQE